MFPHEIQATLFETLLAGTSPVRPDWALGGEVLLILVIGLLTAFSASRLPVMSVPLGIVVVGAADGGQENLAQAPSLRPQVMVVDLGTPGLTNLEAVAQLRAMMPDVRIIAMSQVRSTGYREAALAAGADDLVLKAALVTDLLPAIRRAVENGHPREKPVDRSR